MSTIVLFRAVASIWHNGDQGDGASRNGGIIFATMLLRKLSIELNRACELSAYRQPELISIASKSESSGENGEYKFMCVCWSIYMGHVSNMEVSLDTSRISC